MIELRNVHYAYRGADGDRPVLRGLDLAFRDGERVALMGANGSGKTTLARCLNGLLLPTEGRVWVDGLPTDLPEHLWEVRRRVQMVFQNPDDQLVSVLVEREIAFGLENLGLPAGEMRRRVEEMLERFRLAGYRNHPPHLLSGGEKQRLAAASALAMRPRHLVLDEPTAMLDPEGRREVMTLLADLARSGDVTILHITQTPEEAAAADRMIVLDRGALVFDDSPSRVFSEAGRLDSLGLAPPATARFWSMLGGAGLAPLTPEDLAGRLQGRRSPSADAVPGAVAHRPSSAVHRPPSPDPPLLATEGLVHVFSPGLPGERTALAGVDAEFPRGSFTALVGASGSGKTTFVQHLNALLRPTRGRVRIEGRDLWRRGTDLRQVRRRVGLVFQFAEFQLFEETVNADVGFGPRNLEWDGTRVAEAVRLSLGEVGLDPEAYGSRPPLTLSGGERRRVAIAGVLAMQPEALVLDEPAAGLDPRGAARMEQLLAGLHAAGRTVLLVAHDMDLVARLARRVIVMDRGRVAFSGPPEEVFRRGPELTALGLDLPDAVRIAGALRGKGWPVSPDAMTLEGIARELNGIAPGS